jgi:4-amino-4-deoxy-L-arabinose transferase-like glycosyltransferase
VWAGIALTTSLMFAVAGRAATPDSLLIFSTTLALTIYVCGTFRARHETTPLDAPPQLHTPGQYFPQHWPTVAAMYAAMGLAVLAKGPVGLVLPTAVIGMFLLIVRLPRLSYHEQPSFLSLLRAISRPFEPLHFLGTCWAMRPLTAIFAAAAVALPWYCAVHLATEGAFTRGFFYEHNLERATSAMEGHGGNVLFYPGAILLGFFPWSVFALPLLIDLVLQLRRRESFNPGYVLAACWVGVYVVLFSVAKTKLPSYVTPCYPALALLVGSYVDRWSREATAVAGRWLPISFGSLTLVGTAFAIAIPLIAQRYLPGEEWLGLIGLTPFAGGIACTALVLVRNFRGAAAAFAATAVAFTTMFFAVGTERADRHQSNHLLLESIAARAADPRVASYRILEPSWVYYGGRPILELPRRPGRSTLSAAELQQQTAWLSHFPPPDQVTQHFASHREAFLITTVEHYQKLLPHLPPDVQVLTETQRFLKDDRLVLLGRQSETARLAGSQNGGNSR